MKNVPYLLGMLSLLLFSLSILNLPDYSDYQCHVDGTIMNTSIMLLIMAFLSMCGAIILATENNTSKN